jgi:hypothetical protein
LWLFLLLKVYSCLEVDYFYDYCWLVAILSTTAATGVGFQLPAGEEKGVAGPAAKTFSRMGSLHV